MKKHLTQYWAVGIFTNETTGGLHDNFSGSRNSQQHH